MSKEPTTEELKILAGAVRKEDSTVQFDDTLSPPLLVDKLRRDRDFISGIQDQKVDDQNVEDQS